MEADQALPSAVGPQLCPARTEKKKLILCVHTICQQRCWQPCYCRGWIELIHFVLLVKKALGSTSF